MSYLLIGKHFSRNGFYKVLEMGVTNNKLRCSKLAPLQSKVRETDFRGVNNKVAEFENSKAGIIQGYAAASRPVNYFVSSL